MIGIDLKHIKNIYFLGIGGIGMSALAQYFQVTGKNVAGYDRVSTPLTKSLEEKGIAIHYKDDVSLIPEKFLNQKDTLIVRTPAVPVNHTELQYFYAQGFQMFKRSQILGHLFNSKHGVAVAGTHGKTSISSILSFLLDKTGFDNSAFLGGIVKNYNGNYLIGKSNLVVTEADEYDRSFLQLYPHAALVTAMDADHLDIYTDHMDLIETFNKFISQIKDGGILLHKLGLPVDEVKDLSVFTYSMNDSAADFYAKNIRVENGKYVFDWVTPEETFPDYTISTLGIINIENSIAALSMAFLLDADVTKLQSVLPEFLGIKRRLDKQVETPEVVYIDDYAHHPQELNAAISSVRNMYPGKKITGVFQPHLFTRTRDFADGFALSLSALDEVYLLDIYPAREEPIPGITSEIIFKNITQENKQNCSKENLLNTLKGRYIEVLLTLGAGDIDQLVEPIKKLLEEK